VPLFSSWKHLALVVCTLIGITTLLLPSSSANASEVPDAITSVTVVEDAAQYGDQVRIDVAWALPDTVAAGDTFWLQLPDEFTRHSTTFDLRSPSGDVVATALVAADGRVTFTATSFVETHDGVAGSAYFLVTFSSETSGGETITLEFPTSTTVHSDQIEVIPFTPIDRTRPVKAGFWTDPDDQGLTSPEGALTWSVASPRGPADQLGFRDDATAGQAFRCADLVVERTTTVDAFSGFLLDLVPVPAAEYDLTCSASGWELVLNRPLGADEIIQVTLTADITDPTRSSYANEAVVTTGTTDRPTTATVSRFDAGGVGDGDGMGPLRIVKTVNGDLPEQLSEPFVVRVDCDWNGSPVAGYPRSVTFDGAGSTLLEAPIASRCAATETETGGADKVTVTPREGVTVTKDATGTVEIVVTNTFDPTGSFVVTKELAGPIEPADLASGTTFEVSYTVDGVPEAEPLVLTAGEPTFSPQFPVGTEIVLTENDPDVDVLPDGYFWTGASFTVDGEETDRLTITADGEAQAGTAVTLTNHLATVAPPAVAPGPDPGAPLPDTGSSPWLVPGATIAVVLVAAGGLLVRVGTRYHRPRNV